MKAIVKATGEIVDVYERYDDLAMETVFEELAGSYRPDELDFSVDKAEESEDAVISGWVARDMDGSVFLYQNEPDRNVYEWRAYMMHSLPESSFPSLTWDDDPMEVEITIKPKKK